MKSATLSSPLYSADAICGVPLPPIFSEGTAPGEPLGLCKVTSILGGFGGNKRRSVIRGLYAITGNMMFKF